MSENPLGPIAGPRRGNRRRDVVWSVIIIIVAIIGAWAILTQVNPPPDGETVAASTDPTTETTQSASAASSLSSLSSPSSPSSPSAYPSLPDEPAADPTTGPTTGAPAPAEPVPAASPARSAGTAGTPEPASPTASAAATRPSAPATTAVGPPPSPAQDPGADALPAVVVLNDSRIGGLARDAASRVADAGFVVDRVGNYRGVWNTPATTVYYEPGHEAAAEALRSRVPGVARAVNIDDTQIPRYGKLLLVVTKDFPVDE